ncbi:MAG TPA: hypothetical protein VF591_22835 [Pyrinomonadaceae bacterium]
MKVLAIIFLCLSLLPMTVTGGVKAGRLPEAINSTLNRKFPGWRFSEVSVEVRQFFGERFPDARPDLIEGDFDGNGRTDYAVLIEHTNFNKSGKTFTHVVELLAFLKRGTKYKLYTLKESAPATPELYLTLAGKGSEGRSFHTQSRFRYPYDSITVSYFGKAGGTYIFRRGRFRYVYESD